jgi:hypothetical protein
MAEQEPWLTHQNISNKHQKEECMAETVDDFIKRFGSGGTVDEEQAARYHDRFVSTKPEDSQFDNQAYQQGTAEYLGRLPSDQFHDAARNAIAQAPPQQKQDLLGTLINALGGSGGGLGAIANTLGLGTTDPSRMSGDDAARLLNYTRQQRPDVLQQTVQEKPWFVKAMGNPIVMGALGMAAMKLLGRRRSG